MVGDTIEGTRAGGRFRRRGYAARWGLLAAVGAVVAAAAAGCTSTTGGPGTTTAVGTRSSTVSPTTSPSASVTASLTSTYPADVPPEARANTPAGAKAFARYFFELANKAYTTPQSGLLAPLSTPNCKTCASYEANSQRYVEQRQRHTTDPVEVIETSLAPDTPPGVSQTVDVVIHQRPSHLVDSFGAVVSTLTDRRAVFAVDLNWTGTYWLVNSIQVRQG